MSQVATNVGSIGNTVVINDDVLLGTEHIERIRRECTQLETEVAHAQRLKPEVQVDRQMFWVVTAVYVFLVTVVLTACTILLIRGGDVGLYGITLRHIGIVGVTLTLGHLILMSIDSVRLDEWAGLTFFGRPVWVFEKPGPAFVPSGIFRLVSEPRVMYQDEFPGKPEQIKRTKTDGSGNTTEKYEQGEIRIVPVTTGPPTSKERAVIEALIKNGIIEESTVLFNQFTVDIRWSVFWRVEDLFLYERIIPGDTPEEKRQEVIDRLRKLGEAELKETFKNLTPATVIQCWEMIGKRLALRLRKIALSWGIWIDRAMLGEQNLSHETNKAQADSIRSRFDKIKTERDADAARYKFKNEGQGKADATKAMGLAEAEVERSKLVARAEGMKQIATDLGVTEGQLVLMAETAKAIAAGSNYSLYGGAQGVSDIMAAVSMGKAIPPASRNTPSNTTTPQPPKTK